ncbi:hypothetical protein F4803DRAFT_139510 [Xylaria telfairii]|nr:hypothetical protein F4803DRAFT_139510 [Xylaria telfairii]
MASTAPPYHLPTNTSEASLKAPTLPPYTEHASASPLDEDIELASISSSSSSAPSYVTSPPSAAGPSSPSSPIFTPTKHLQIQSQGKTLISFPTPQRPDPIPIFTVNADGSLERPLYLSVRPQARSGSCFLTHGDDEAQAALTTTTYRFGPGRAPVVVLGDPARDPAISSETEGQSFEIPSRSLFSRGVLFAVPGLGTFEWRYASSKERAAFDADSLLVCEVYVETTAGAKHDDDGRSKKKIEEKGQGPLRIAQLVRNETFRSPGTSRTSAGNGGRLMLDLAFFEEKRRERAEWLVVTTAVTMLKREVDRRRVQQMAVIGAIAS